MTNFAAMTNEQINMWAAERDGFQVRSGNHDEMKWVVIIPSGEELGLNDEYVSKVLPNYATSADAAISLCERWGLEIADCLQRGDDYRVRLFVNPIGNPPQRAHHGPTFARAVTNAACAAKEAMGKERNDDEMD